METTVVGTIWQKSKLMVKALIIGVVALALMIPAYFVNGIVQEREARQKEAVFEVSSKWAGQQNVTGPVLVLPYAETVSGQNGGTVTLRKLAYILPEELRVDATLDPQEKSRGIYKVMLYSSKMDMTAKFAPIPFSSLRIAPQQVLWNEAYVALSIGDAKGLGEALRIKWNDTLLTLNPVRLDNGVMQEAFTAPVQVSEGASFSFSATMNLRGSGQYYFTPVGRETTVNLTSTWPDPAFNGNQLPEHDISDKGFTAKWKSLSHNRNFPQAWKDASYHLGESSFGVNLYIPVNGYQKTMRSVKYAILCILLTFAAFFLIENVNKKSVHPFQYALIGVALILFYTLLLSISEYTGFNTAYIISSVATIGLIGWYVRGILSSGKLSSLLSVVLVLMYSYIFSLLQLQDYSLLLGSVGLFLTLAVIMYYTRKISW